jgi:hypothetical protein
MKLEDIPDTFDPAVHVNIVLAAWRVFRWSEAAARNEPLTLDEDDLHLLHTKWVGACPPTVEDARRFALEEHSMALNAMTRGSGRGVARTHKYDLDWDTQVPEHLRRTKFERN